MRGKDIDEEKANAAKLAAEEAVKNAKTDVDMARARSELTILAAELSALRRYRAHKSLFVRVSVQKPLLHGWGFFIAQSKTVDNLHHA